MSIKPGANLPGANQSGGESSRGESSRGRIVRGRIFRGRISTGELSVSRRCLHERCSYKVSRLAENLLQNSSARLAMSLDCAPSSMADLYRPVSDLAIRRALRSSATWERLVPRVRSSLRQRRVFSIIRPSIWNGFPLSCAYSSGIIYL